MFQVPPFHAVRAVRIGAAIALSAAVLVTLTPPCRAAVFGTDDRTPLSTEDTHIENYIGTLVSSENGAYCTAFCVAPDMIVTASHCLFGTAVSAAPKLKDMSFTPASGSSSPAVIAGGTAAMQSRNVLSGTTRLAVTPPIGAARDWAVARLDKPVCKAGGLKLSQKSVAEIRQEAERGNVFQIAVHSDLPDTKLHRGGPCAILTSFPSADEKVIARDFANPAAILFHACDTGGGSSGSPLLIDTPTGPEVAGINVGTYVLSRGVTTSEESGEKKISEPIANTAIWIAAIASAVHDLSVAPTLAAPVVTGAIH